MSPKDKSGCRFFVYYLHGADGDVLYVGRSGNVAKRVKMHAWRAESDSRQVYGTQADWMPAVRSVSMVGPFTWGRAVAFEGFQIRTIQPRGNIRLTRRDRCVRRVSA